MRAEAKALGLKRYFTGKPCKRGHVAERSVHRAMCVECKNDATRDDYHKRIGEWRDRNRQKMAKYRSDNPEKYRQRFRLWWGNNKEFFRQIWRDYYNKDPIKHRIRSHQRRAGNSNFGSSDIQEIMVLQKGKCANCQRKFSKKVRMHIDHIIPLARGGSSFRRNLQLLCAACNLTKSARCPLEFARASGKLL